MATGAAEFADKTIMDGVHIADYWSTKTIDATESHLVFGNVVDRSWEADAKVGKTIKRGSIGNLAARAKSENTAITYETVAETATTITLNKIYYAAFAVEEVVDVQSHVNLAGKYQDKMGYAIAKQIDDDLADLVSGLSQTVGTLGTNFTDDNLLRAIQYLDDADAPQNDRALVISPAEHANLMKLDKYTSVDYVPFRPVDKGKVPHLYGIPVMVTTNLNKPSANQADCALLHREALACVIQRKPKFYSFMDIDYLATKYALSVIYGVGEVRDPFGVWVKAAS